MKSNLISVMWPTWEWIHKPHLRYQFASYAAGLSTKHSVDRRTIIQSSWYQDNWGDVYQMTTDQNVKTEYVNDKRGHMIATSVGGTATGKGGDRVIVDDPHNPRQALSEVQREAGVSFFNQTLSTRLDNKKTGVIVVVMQRLHENDLTGHLLSQGGWEHLSIPAEAESSTIVYFPSGKEVARKPGELLWPEREGKKEMVQAKIDLGTYGFAGQYQQHPSPLEGGLLKRDWWKEYKQDPKTIRFNEVIQSWDCAFKDLKTSDYVVGQVWGRIGADKYLLDQVRDRMDMPTTMAAVRALSAKWPEARAKLVEDKANGSAVIQMLKKDIPGLLAVEPEGGKIARVQAVSLDVEAGNVYLPAPEIAPWINDFIEECAAFPNAANDDQVDSMSQALIRFSQQSMYDYGDVSLEANMDFSRESPHVLY